MKPLTLVVLFGAVAFASISFNKWAQTTSSNLESAAKDCEQAKPFTRSDNATSIEDQQRAMLKAAECAYGMVNPVAGAVMKHQGIDPQDAIEQFRKLESNIPAK